MQIAATAPRVGGKVFQTGPHTHQAQSRTQGEAMP
jgi:hypothetical protein